MRDRNKERDTERWRKRNEDIDVETDRYIDKYKDGQIDGQTDGQIDRQTYRQITSVHTDRETYIYVIHIPLLPDIISPTPPYFPLTDSSIFFAAPRFSNSVYGSKVW